MNDEPVWVVVLGLVMIACTTVVAMDVSRKCTRFITGLWASRKNAR